MLHCWFVDEKGCTHAGWIDRRPMAHFLDLNIISARTEDCRIATAIHVGNRSSRVWIQTSYYCELWLLGILVRLYVVNLLDANSFVDMLSSRGWCVLWHWLGLQSPWSGVIAFVLAQWSSSRGSAHRRSHWKSLLPLFAYSGPAEMLHLMGSKWDSRRLF